MVESWDLCITRRLWEILLGRSMLEFAPHCPKKTLKLYLPVLCSAPHKNLSTGVTPLVLHQVCGTTG